MKRIWLLNPDCERELAHHARNPRSAYTTAQPLIRQMLTRRALYTPLVGSDPAYFLHEVAQLSRNGWAPPQRKSLAEAWCPTNQARKVAEAAGLLLAPGPHQDILCLVHHKSFLAGVAAMPRPDHHSQLKSWSDWCALRRSTNVPLRIKHAYGFAGKGQRVIPLHYGADDERWIRQGLSHGTMIAEKDLANGRVLSIHGRIPTPPGTPGVQLGRPCLSNCDRFGAPSLPIVRVPEQCAESRALAEQMRNLGLLAAGALRDNGYFGPFGLDVIQDVDGQLYAIDLNPRYTLGWPIGMGEQSQLPR